MAVTEIRGERSQPVLTSKLTPPSLPPGTIWRDGPIRLLAGTERVVLVVAPPGYGKTVMVRQWLDRAAAPTVWLSVDLIDTSPQAFWSHLLAGLRTVLEGIDAEAELLLEERGADSVFLADLIGQIERVDRPMNVVLDDLSRVETPAILDGLTLLVERVGHLVRLVVTSRSELLAPLAAWRAKGWVAEVREEDLRFDDSEAIALAVKLMDAPVDEAAVLELNWRLEGWPIAMRLAVRSADTAPVAESRTGASAAEQVLADYLVTQVLDRLPEEQRHVALSLSVLQWFDVDLCRQLPDGDVTRVVRELERQHLFLHVIDEQRGAMRFHSLARQILQRELHWRDASYHDQLHRTAADLWLARGEVFEAHRHLATIGDTRGAFALIIQPALDLVDRGDRAGLARLVASLPSAAEVDDPSLAMDMAIVSFFARRRHDAARWCDQAEQHNTSSDPTIRLRLHAMRSLLALEDGDLDSAAEHAERFERQAPHAREIRDPAVNWFATTKARIALAGGHYERAREAIDEVAAITEPQTIVKVTAPALEAWLHLDLGRLRPASAQAEQASAWAASSGVHLHHGALDAFVVAGWCRVGAGDLATATELAETARSHAEALGFPWDRARAGGLVAEVLRLRGEHRASVEAVRDLRAEIGHLTSALVAQSLDRAEAAVLVADKQWEAADQVIDRLPDGALRRLLLARLAVGRADDHHVPQLLAERHTWPTHRRMEAEVLLAAASRPTHRDDLSVLLALGAETGWVSPFLGHGERVAHLLRLAPVERLHPALANAIVPGSGQRGRPPRGVPDALTPRELNVLAFLPTHLSYAQIGARMYLSVNTIKTILKSVYRKLHVSSRGEAVDAAREAGLL